MWAFVQVGDRDDTVTATAGGLGTSRAVSAVLPVNDPPHITPLRRLFMSSSDYSDRSARFEFSTPKAPRTRPLCADAFGWLVHVAYPHFNFTRAVLS
jgi:hypothetical protein